MRRKICIWICALKLRVVYISLRSLYRMQYIPTFALVLLRHFPVRHFPVRHFQSAIFQSVIFQSCKFHPCDFVRHFPVLQIPPLRLRPSFSSHANSSPANSAIPCQLHLPRRSCTSNLDILDHGHLFSNYKQGRVNKGQRGQLPQTSFHRGPWSSLYKNTAIEILCY